MNTGKQTTNNLDSKEIMDALERIPSLGGLDRDSNAFSILSYMVNETLSDRGHLLKGYSIGQDVLGKGPNFDPTTDSSVRVEVKKLREKLDHFYETSGSKERVVIAINRGSYQPQFLLNHGTESPNFFAQHVRTPQGSLRYLPYSAGLVLLIAIVALAMLGPIWLNQKVKVDGEPVVVLQDPDPNIAFAITKQTLSRFHNFKLTEKNSADNDAADYVLAIRADPTGATLELSQNNSNKIIANSYFLNSDMGVESEANESSELRYWLGRVFGRNGRMETDFKAYLAPSGDFACSILVETYFANQTDSNHLSARECIENFLNAGHVTPRLLSDLTLITREEFSDQRNLLPGDPLARAADYARQAIALDPFDPQSHYSLMTVLFLTDATDEAIKAGQRAIALNPFDSEIVGGYAARINILGKHVEAENYFERRAKLSPSTPSWMFHGRFLAKIGLGETSDAAEISENLIGSSNPLYIAATAIGASIKGNHEEALRLKSNLLAKETDIKSMYTRRRYADTLVEALMTQIDQIQ